MITDLVSETESLVLAVWQVLDDMGKNGRSSCEAAKAALRIAYEPFADDDDKLYNDWMSLAEAQAIIDSLD